MLRNMVGTANREGGKTANRVCVRVRITIFVEAPLSAVTLKKTSCEGFLNLKWYPCHWMSWSNNTQVIDVPVVVGPGTRNSSIYDGPRSVRQIVIRLCRRATHRERREYEYRQCRRIFRYAPQARIQTPGAKTYLSSDVRNPSNHSCNELAYTIARAGRSAIAENFAGLCRTRKRGGGTTGF